MKTLLGVKFNWPVYFLLLVIVRMLFIDISWVSFLALSITIQQFILLFNSLEFVIPVRYLLGSFMCIQFFVGPAFAYNGLDKFQYFMYQMRIPEEQYFSYAIPAVCAFILGLHITAGKLKGEFVDREGIVKFVAMHPRLPYTFIVLGFFASILSGFFSSEVSFVFYLMGSLKFVGLFLLILGSRSLKVASLSLVIGSIISSSLGAGMFHDLITWVIFTIAVFAIKYKFSTNVKLGGAFGFLLIVVTIQTLKGAYRTSIASDTGNAGLNTFVDLAEKKDKEGEGLFSFKSLAESNVRINQGFIITNIMKTIPEKLPYQNGTELYQILEAAVLPRVLAPNKLKAGDRDFFMKYSGIQLRQGTSMGLSSVGDAYINFGTVGGCIFMFFLGLMYSEILNFFYKHSKKYPALILFTALVFYYPIRPDCELQTILGHLFKSCFLIYVMMQVSSRTFYVPRLFKKNPAKPVIAEA